MVTLATPELDADQLIEMLELEPHPEGGHFRETFRDDIASLDKEPHARARSTAIYYLLKAGERSHWHRVDAAEIWHWYAGAPLKLSLAMHGGDTPEHLILGPNIADDERPQRIIPAHAWQAAVSMGSWTLVGCTVAPGFEFKHFELGPPGWHPGSISQTNRTKAKRK